MFNGSELAIRSEIALSRPVLSVDYFVLPEVLEELV